MNVGSCLRDRSAFTFCQNHQFFYGKLCGIIYGNQECPQFLASIKNATPYASIGIALNNFF